MSNNKISYLSRTFDDYKESLKGYIREYYPQIANDFDDASIGNWLIDMVAAVADNLSYHIDRTYSETNLESATQEGSIYNIARTNGFKVPGPKGAIAEVEFSCIVDTPPTSLGTNDSSTLGTPDKTLLPIIRRGTKVSSRGQVFEVMDDIDFSEQTNRYGISNRTIIPLSNVQGGIPKYQIIKTDIVVAGESKVYRQEIKDTDIAPFMEIVLPDANVMNVESIIFKDGNNYKKDPTMSEFMTPAENFKNPENVEVHRFFEVDSLAEQYRWGDELDFKDGTNALPQSKTYTYGFHSVETGENVPVAAITKGKWQPVTQKFMTEFTNNGYLKITFGPGEPVGQSDDKYEGTTDFSQYQISRMIRNNFLGKLPKAGWTMYVLYRVGGGAASNVPAGAINNIEYLNVSFRNNIYTSDTEVSRRIAEVKNSISVTNTKASVSGKDSPSIDEIKMMIKYNNAAQERCVTVKDYENRIMLMPPRYGCPFRVSAVEENNKVKIFVLGLNSNGKLNAVIPEMLIKNMTEYLSKYRSINDFVVIEPGEVIHLSFGVDVMVDKNYNNNDIAEQIIKTIKDYMDINKHHLGEDIFVGDIEKEISNIDGVLNLIELRVYNKYKTNSAESNGYSSSRIAQTIDESDSTDGKDRIYLKDTNYVLNSNVDSMFEINNPDTDIVVRMIER